MIIFETVDTKQVLSVLIEERNLISEVISALEAIAISRGDFAPKRAVNVSSQAETAVKPGRKKGAQKTAAQRKAQAERMKAYWARKKSEG